MKLGLEKKHVLITGASQGIGRSLAEEFSKEGARLSLIARREEKLKQVVSSIGGREKGHRYYPCDLMQPFELRKTIDHIFSEQGNVDVVVHNLGGTLGYKELVSSSDEWQRIWKFNVGISIDINEALIPRMKESGWGRIIHVISTAADDLSGAGPYSAAKAYLKAYVQIMGRALASTGVVVSGVSPGAIGAHENNWVQKSANNPALVQNFLQNHQAIGRLGRGDELSPFVLLLASEIASFACASILPIHGGCM